MPVTPDNPRFAQKRAARVLVASNKQYLTNKIDATGKQIMSRPLTDEDVGHMTSCRITIRRNFTGSGVRAAKRLAVKRRNVARNKAHH